MAGDSGEKSRKKTERTTATSESDNHEDTLFDMVSRGEGGQASAKPKRGTKRRTSDDDEEALTITPEEYRQLREQRDKSKRLRTETNPSPAATPATQAKMTHRQMVASMTTREEKPVEPDGGEEREVALRAESKAETPERRPTAIATTPHRSVLTAPVRAQPRTTPPAAQAPTAKTPATSTSTTAVSAPATRVAQGGVITPATRTAAGEFIPRHQSDDQAWHIPRVAPPEAVDDDDIDEDPSAMVAFHAEQIPMTLEAALQPVILDPRAWKTWMDAQRRQNRPYYDMVGVPVIQTRPGQTLGDMDDDFWEWVAATKSVRVSRYRKADGSTKMRPQAVIKVRDMRFRFARLVADNRVADDIAAQDRMRTHYPEPPTWRAGPQVASTRASSSLGMTPSGAIGGLRPPTRGRHPDSPPGVARGAPMSFGSSDTRATSPGAGARRYDVARQPHSRHGNVVHRLGPLPAAAPAQGVQFFVPELMRMETQLQELSQQLTQAQEDVAKRFDDFADNLQAQSRRLSTLEPQMEQEMKLGAESRGFVNQNWCRLEMTVDSRMGRHLERVERAEYEDRQEVIRLGTEVSRLRGELQQLRQVIDRSQQRAEPRSPPRDRSRSPTPPREPSRSRSRSPEHRPYNPYW